MSIDVTAALDRVVADVGADAGLLVTVGADAVATAAATTIGPPMRPGEQWPAGGALAEHRDQPFVVDDPAEHSRLLPTAARLALACPAVSVLVVPVPGSASRLLLVWCGDAPDDLLGRAERVSVQLFLSFVPLLEAHAVADARATQLSTVVEALEQAVVITSAGSHTAAVNGAAAALLGIADHSPSTAEAAAALHALRLRAEDPARIEAEVAAAITLGDMATYDTVWRFDRSPTHLRVHSAPVGAHDGRVWVFDDVSREMELLQREQEVRLALAESEQRFRLIAENSSDILFQNVEGVLQWISPNVTMALGWEPEELVGRTTQHLWHPDHLERAVMLRGLAYSGHSVRDELRIRRKDGEYLWVEVALQPFVDADGRPGSIGLMHDVTDRVLATEAAERSEQQYRLLAEHASDVVFQGSPEAVVTWVSPSVEDVLGFEPEEVIGRSVTSLLHPDDVPAVVSASRRVNDGRRITYRARYRRADGELRWCEVVARPAFDEEGNIVSRVGSLRDVHDQVTAELALGESEAQARQLAAQAAAARDDAERANLEKTSFLSRMSHELRTPLNAVIGYAQLLELDDLTDTQRSALRQIRAGGTHLLDLITEILDISRIEAGRLHLSIEPVGVAEVLGAALDLVDTTASTYRIELRPPAAVDASLMVAGDRQRLIQILINLLTNAVKYNRPNGHVDITCTAGDGTVAIAVRDTGRGIPAEKLGHVFDPFDRLGAETTEIEGTGIGLTLSQALAGAMGGRIDVASVVDEGSTFTLVLRAADGPDVAGPAEGPAITTGTPASPAAAPPGGPRRVLYVEDNEQNATLMRRLLSTRRDGVDLRVARTAADGIAAVGEHPVDLVFLDLHLPDAPGTDVLAAIRREPALTDLPVVVLTADASPGLRRTILDQGATAFVTKPFDIREVLDWVDRVPHRG